MLTSLILLPIVGIVVLLVISNERNERFISLGFTLLTFILSLVLLGLYDSNTAEMQFTTHNNLIELGLDGISLYFVLLTTFTMPICLLSSWTNITSYIKAYNILLLLLESLLLCVFLVQNLLYFYIFFEAVLIPLFILIGIWGSSANRIRAAFLLFLYTLIGSLFMLLCFIMIIELTGTGNFLLLNASNYSIDFNTQYWLWLGIFVSLAIKTPLIPFHIWLSRAHVEASVGVSMILAGLILKLATYGFIRILIPLLPEATSYFTPLVQTIAVITLIYSSLTTLRQTDFKILVAYSSVAHMAVVIIGLFSNTLQGIEGALLLGLAHGLVSPALFLCVGGILYDRYHTRVIRYYRGLSLLMPLFSTLFFLVILANMSTPLTINWIAETLSIMGALQRSPLTAIAISSGIVLSAAYSIYLFARLCTGDWSIYLMNLFKNNDINRREFMILIPLIFTTYLFGIIPNFILNDLHFAVSLVLYS